MLERQHIINVAIGLLRQDLLAHRALDQDPSPAVRSAILNRPEQCRAMLRAPLQRQRMSGPRQRLHRAEAIRARTRKKPKRRARRHVEPTHEMALAPCQSIWTSMTHELWTADALRQTALHPRLSAQFIAARCRQVRQPVVQLKNKRGRRQRAQRDGRDRLAPSRQSVSRATNKPCRLWKFHASAAQEQGRVSLRSA
jgi:hypothetical protein